jgi:hypothetical protein
MNESIESKLLEMPAARLAKIVMAALGAMGEADQINFVAKHIDARASLERLGAGRDIYIYLRREDEFRLYFKDVIAQNSRRPALRDEMRIVYGAAATAVKK